MQGYPDKIPQEKIPSNAVEREPVQIRVLITNASEASYEPKQRGYTKINLKKKVLAPDSPGAEMSGAEMSSAETAAPNRTRPILKGAGK